MSLALVSKVRRTAKLTAVEPLIGSTAKVVQSDTIDPMFDIEVDFKGAIPAGLLTGGGLSGGNAVAGITGGKTLIESIKYTQRNREYDSGSFKAINAPSAA